MAFFNIVAQSSESTVVTEYKSSSVRSEAYQSEADLEREFIKLLRTLHSTFVKTIIIVSHDMDLVAENCTGVAVFANGKILKQGTPKQVFSDAQFIKEQGLELPVTAKLQNALKEKGVIVDSDLTVDGFISAYLQQKGVVKP